MLENHQRQTLYRFTARIFSYPERTLLADQWAEIAAVAGLLMAFCRCEEELYGIG